MSAPSRSLMESSVAANRILVEFIGAIFHRFEVFKEFALNLKLEAVEILSRF